MSDDVPELTYLGRPGGGPIDHVECFPAPDGCTRVRFMCAEVTSLGPINGQPDFANVEIDYQPNLLCVESKSLRLYLQSFRDKETFAEQLAVDIATEIRRAAEPTHVKVTVTQSVRGGIVTETTAELP